MQLDDELLQMLHWQRPASLATLIACGSGEAKRSSRYTKYGRQLFE
jgi:hypothetical protein